MTPCITARMAIRIKSILNMFDSLSMLLLTPFEALLIFLESETKLLIFDAILAPIDLANLIADLVALLKAD